MRERYFSHETSRTELRVARRRPRRRGFSLVEVMVGLMIISTSSLAALAGLLFSYRVSDANVRALAAMAQARAVVEKAITLDYATLSQATLPIDVPCSTSGSLTVNTWNDRRDDVHNTPGDQTDDLVFGIRPEVTQSKLATGMACSQVIVRVRWQDHAMFRTRMHEDALTTVVAQVPSY